MITSPENSILSRPEGVELIPVGTLAYFRGRNRWAAYELVLTEFQKSGLSQADLARRLGKRPEVISRLLGAPGNWGLDTASDLLFAIAGAEPVYGIQYPLNEPARNFRQPEWLIDSEPATAAAYRYKLAKEGFTLGTNTNTSASFTFTARV